MPRSEFVPLLGVLSDIHPLRPVSKQVQPMLNPHPLSPAGFEPAGGRPLLEVQTYSGGRQSEWLLESYRRGERRIRNADSFVVINSGPGMERTTTRLRVARMESRCLEAGIDFRRAPGPNLYTDLLDLHAGEKNRIDNPPFWVHNADGTRGKLQHNCTREYKIRPMRRMMRQVLFERWGIPVGPRGNHALRPNAVRIQIGFSAGESSRIKPPRDDDPAWCELVYPLVEAGVTDDVVAAVYRRWGISPPDISMCNGCPFQGLRNLRSMSAADIQQTITVDRVIRDLSAAGVKRPAYVSDTLIPMAELAEQEFSTGDEVTDDMHQCTSGVCFA